MCNTLQYVFLNYIEILIRILLYIFFYLLKLEREKEFNIILQHHVCL